MRTPTISVIMPTYNHEAFVGQAIESVLAQTGTQLELLIADDGSTDGTPKVVESFNDSRIRFFPSRLNRGANIVVNESLKRASGDYIALINSDDYWLKDDKLSEQIKILKNNPRLGASFGRARFVDAEGREIQKSSLPQGSVFDQKNRSRGEWLRHFFDRGNCICHPTMVIRKECFDVIGFYDNRFRQLPDWDMWIRLVKCFDIDISSSEWIAFRQLPGENASSPTLPNYNRLLNESYFILQGFFNGVPRDVFFSGFGDKIQKPFVMESADNNEAYIDIEQAVLYLSKDRWASHIYNHIGLEKLYSLLGSDKHRQLLIEEYGIDDHKFQSMSSELTVFRMPDMPSTPSTKPTTSLQSTSDAPIFFRRALNKLIGRTR